MGKQNVNAKPSYAFQKLRTQKLFVKYYLLSPLEFIFIYFLQLMTNVSSLYKNSTSIFLSHVRIQRFAETSVYIP